MNLDLSLSRTEVRQIIRALSDAQDSAEHAAALWFGDCTSDGRLYLRDALDRMRFCYEARERCWDLLYPKLTPVGD